jgi:hypothetical protein
VSPFQLGNGCSVYNSILVKFDYSYDNTRSGAEGNLTGYYTNGQDPQAPEDPQYDQAASGIHMQSGSISNDGMDPARFLNTAS